MRAGQTRPEETAVGNDERERRVPYSPPELVEWGTIRDLTRGADFGNEDFDFTGTQPT